MTKPTPEPHPKSNSGRKLALLLIGGLALFSASCSAPGVKILTQPITDSALVGSLLNSNQLTEASKSYLESQGLVGTYRKDPAAAIAELQTRLDSDPSHELRLSLIELCNDTGARLAPTAPEEAAGYHLAAADLAFEVGTSRPELVDEREELVAAYNFSAGRVATLLFEIGSAWDEVVAVEGPWKTYQVSSRTEGKGYLDPSFFDTLVPADQLQFKKVPVERITQEGLGAALVGHREGTEERRAENPMLPAVGMSLPVNATLDFSPGGGRVELAFHDLMVTDKALVNGKEIVLEADLSAPLALLFNYQVVRNFAWQGLVKPDEFLEAAGLYQLEPHRPDQIPVIFVHGLVSSPKVWLTAVNELRTDPVLRAKYQVYLFQYPTGFPIVQNAASLRSALAEFRERLDPNRTNPRMENLILVGHSMGGVLSSMQIRDSGDTMTSRIFTRPIDELGGIGEEEKATLRELLIYEANPDIARVIFVAAPHRGSESASGFARTLGKSLIKFPIDLVVSTQLAQIEGLTDLGREVVNSRPDSIDSLQPNAPGLLAVLEQPIREGVIYHSILGRVEDEKVPLADSSDGTVPYWSSHLEGAESEVVYPAAHTPLTRHPRTIEEARRLLYLHAGLPYTPKEVPESTGEEDS